MSFTLFPKEILLSLTVYHSRDYPIAPDVVVVKNDLLTDNQLQKQFK